MGASPDLIPIRAPGTGPTYLIAFNFTTDGSGNMTVSAASNRYGNITLTKAGNIYTLNVGGFRALLGGIAYAGATTATAITASPSAGTIAVNFGAAINGVTHGAILLNVEV